MTGAERADDPGDLRTELAWLRAAARSSQRKARRWRAGRRQGAAFSKSGAWMPAMRMRSPVRHQRGPSPSWTRMTWQVKGAIAVASSAISKGPDAENKSCWCSTTSL